jgi:Leucine-rich repeat (LRR) protein
MFLQYNSLTGTLPSEFESFPGLSALYAYGNALNGTVFPESICNSQGLNVIFHLQTYDSCNLALFKQAVAMCQLSKGWGLDTGFSGVSGWACRNGQPEVTYGVCGWSGVSCSGGLITYLSIPKSGLGQMSSFIGDLTSLQTLNGQYLLMRGTIPSSVGKLTALRYLYLHGNRLTGSIPSSLSQLTLLNHMYLYSNSLTGTLPSSFASLTQINTMAVYDNRLANVYPTTFCATFPATKIQYLHSYSGCDRGLFDQDVLMCKIAAAWGLDRDDSGAYGWRCRDGHPLAIGGVCSGWGGIACTSGYVVRITYAPLSRLGQIPEAMGNLTKLISFNIAYYDVYGTIPETFSRLVLLTDLRMNRNRLSGSLPSSLSKLTALRYMYLNDNRLTGTIPPSFGSMTALLNFHLYNNQMDTTYPTAVCQTLGANVLYHLYAYSGCNQLLLAQEKDMCKFAKDWGLDNGAASVGVSGWKCSNGRPIAVNGQGFCGWSGVVCSGYYLYQLSPPKSGMGQIPESIGNLTTLQYLYFGSRNIRGTIPSAIGKLTLLRSANFEENRLTGTIPVELTRLTSMNYLYLQNNQLGGTLPLGFVSMGNLYNLHVSKQIECLVSCFFVCSIQLFVLLRCI